MRKSNLVTFFSFSNRVILVFVKVLRIDGLNRVYDASQLLSTVLFYSRIVIIHFHLVSFIAARTSDFKVNRG